MTKLRVNRPRARPDAPPCDVSAEPTSSADSGPASRQAVAAGGQVRPSQERTSPPASPVRAAASTYSKAVG